MVSRQSLRSRLPHLLLLSACAACGLLYIFSARQSLPRPHVGSLPTETGSQLGRDEIDIVPLDHKLNGADMGGGASKSGWEPSKDQGVERKYSNSGYDITPLTMEERNRIAKELPGNSRKIALNSGTEPAFTGQTVNGYSHDNKAAGLYVSAVGGLPLFSSDTKFDSGTGWPSFFAPVDPEHIIEISDTSIPFMPRVEVVDARGGAHLGHVFNDGPAPTRKRYCMNAAAMLFIPKGDRLPVESQPAKMQQKQSA